MAALRAHVLRRLAYWQRRLGLQNYRVDLDAVDAEHIQQTEDQTLLARMHRDPTRLTGTLHVALRRSAEELEGDVCHECLHLLLAETDEFVHGLTARLGDEACGMARRQWADIEERHTTALERALLQTD